MKKFPIMEKFRAFRCSLGRKKSAPLPPPRRDTRLRATARRATLDEYDSEDDQPTTKLSSAFIVVLILHIVAVGGIFAFKGIKAHRLSREVPVASTTSHPAIVPHPAAGETASPVAPVVAEATPITLPQKIYVAHGGETLARVAQQQGVNVNELALHNGLKPGDVLKPKQNVVIPAPKTAKTASQSTPNKTTLIASTATPAPGSQEAKRADFLKANKEDTQFLKGATPKPAAATPAKAGAKTYTVAKNDTVTSIAKKHGVSVDALVKLNHIDDPKKLQLNQTLQIPAKKTE
jgi:LysM repeat protein